MSLHATCVALENHGVLLTGAPGVGKSDLALRLIAAGAVLVADDQVDLRVENGQLLVSAPDALKGLLEVRHVGLLRLPFQKQVTLALQVEVTTLDERLERLPEPKIIFHLDQPLRCLRLPAQAASTPAKIRAALLYPDETDEH